MSGPIFNLATLALSGSDASSDGVVTAVQDLCLGGTFGADPTTCSGALLSMTVLEDELGPIGPSQLFLGSSFFDVFVDITIDGGTFGSAELDGTVRNQYTSDQVIPEPTSLLLIGSGLAGLASRPFRRPRHAPRTGLMSCGSASTASCPARIDSRMRSSRPLGRKRSDLEARAGERERSRPAEDLGRFSRGGRPASPARSRSRCSAVGRSRRGRGKY